MNRVRVMETARPQLAYGRALAMQYVGFALRKLGTTSAGLKFLLQLSGVEPRHLGAAIVGCRWAENIMTALAVELALKALLLKEAGGYRPIHDLRDLYDDLPIGIRGRLDKRFGELHEGALCDLLTAHRDDFVGWRYLENSDHLHGDWAALQLAVSAVLDVHDDPATAD